jgi:Salt stress response/antifungal
MTVPKSILFSSLLLVFLQPKTKSQFLDSICDTSSYYSTNSTFATNLNCLLTSLTVKTPQTGFFNDTQGLPPDQVYGLALCRGDISSENCTDCLQMAARDMPNLCPYNKGNIAWYDGCLVRYENRDFFLAVDDSLHVDYYFQVNVSDPVQFEDRLVLMIESISKIAAFNASHKYFATGMIDVSGSMKIYGMVQCTRDLSTEHCFKCLNDSLRDILGCCYGFEKAMALRGSCELSYDLDRFYHSDPTWVTPHSPSPSPLPGPPSQVPESINLTKKGETKNMNWY